MDRQWDDFLPCKEYQSKGGLETYNCTNYGTLNAIEILYKRLFNKEVNYSERYTGIMSGTTQEGNSIQNVIETIRKVCGLIPESLLPFDDSINTWDKYYSPKPMTQGLLDVGKAWLKQFQLGHEWIFTLGDGKDRVKRLKECLQYSPIGVSVCAWTEDNGLYIKEPGDQDNHWVCCYGYEDGQYWKIFDSYDNTNKKLAWDYSFGYGKRFVLTELMTPEEKLPLIVSLYQRIVDITQQLIIAYKQLNEKVRGWFGGIFKGSFNDWFRKGRSN